MFDIDAQDEMKFGLIDDCYRFPQLQDYIQITAGASLTAAQMLVDGRAQVAINWDGGRHHCQKYFF